MNRVIPEFMQKISGVALLHECRKLRFPSLRNRHNENNLKKARHPGNRDSDYPGSMLNFMYRKLWIFAWNTGKIPGRQQHHSLKQQSRFS